MPRFAHCVPPTQMLGAWQQDCCPGRPHSKPLGLHGGRKERKHTIKQAHMQQCVWLLGMGSASQRTKRFGRAVCCPASSKLTSLHVLAGQHILLLCSLLVIGAAVAARGFSKKGSPADAADCYLILGAAATSRRHGAHSTAAADRHKLLQRCFPANPALLLAGSCCGCGRCSDAPHGLLVHFDNHAHRPLPAKLLPRHAAAVALLHADFRHDGYVVDLTSKLLLSGRTAQSADCSC